jgi:hypothetical protein
METLKKYQRKGKSVYLDIIREMFVLATPEEKIRQKLLIRLTDKWKISKNLIRVEENMSHHKKGVRDRADIVVLHPKSNKPFILYEIKKEDWGITDDTLQQAKKYNEHLNCKFICITNIIAEIWYSTDNGKINRIETPNSFDSLLKSKIKYSQDYEFIRQTLKECDEEDYFKAYNFLGVIGDDTPKKFHPFLVNLHGFLSDNIKYVTKPIKSKDFVIIEDGIRSSSYGNAGGGAFDGFFRYFILQFPNGDNNIVSLSLFGIAKAVNDPQWGNRNAHTGLFVAIDDFERKHMSLELNIDKFLISNNNSWQLIHNGKLTVGKLGAAKKAQVIDFCKKHIPDLVKGDNIFLGELPKKALFNWDNSSEVIINLIRYALVRDKYRQMHKES